MLTRSLPSQPIPSGGTPAAPVRNVAGASLRPVRHAPLSLPTISPEVPHKVTFRDGGAGAGRFATMLVHAGVLQRAHWNGSILESCEAALRAYTDAVRPYPLAPFKLYVQEQSEHSSHGVSHGYEHKYKFKATPSLLSTLSLVVDPLRPIHRNIGPNLRRMEKHREGLGQTVLKTINDGLGECCRGMTPRTGIDWASNAYWCGEANEDYRVEDELENHLIDNYNYEKGKLPQGADVIKEIGKPPTAADVDIFRRKDYDAAIPGWAGTGRIQSWSLVKLARFRTADKKLRRVVAATTALRSQIKPTREDINDLACFETTSWDVTPFILRWNGHADPLGQIYDDVLNPEFESGDTDMETNAIFAFHDERSLAHALRRLRRYLELMQLCENLIRLIGTEM